MSTIAQGNWTSMVQAFVKDKDVANYIVSGGDPAVGCYKDFTATYQCGSLPNVKTITLPGEAAGKSAVFDCSAENQACSGFRLTLGDDGNLVLTNLAGNQIWSSNTNKTGLALDDFKMGKGKYARNYLLAGETLSLGEFIGSPSGNCYLIMAQGPDGNGLQLNYSVADCSEQNFGNDESINGLFSLANTAYNQLMGTQNTVVKNLPLLGKTQSAADNLFRETAHGMNTAVQDYMGTRQARPAVQKHITQLEAMDEDSALFLNRYKYRRAAWFTLAILVLLGAIKLARKTNV
jgi:hypothetical protein